MGKQVGESKVDQTKGVRVTYTHMFVPICKIHGFSCVYEQKYMYLSLCWKMVYQFCQLTAICLTKMVIREVWTWSAEQQQQKKVFVRSVFIKYLYEKEKLDQQVNRQRLGQKCLSCKGKTKGTIKNQGEIIMQIDRYTERQKSV